MATLDTDATDAAGGDGFSSHRGPSTVTILRISASAALMNAVVPLALAVQVSLIGKGSVFRKGGGGG